MEIVDDGSEKDSISSNVIRSKISIVDFVCVMNHSLG